MWRSGGCAVPEMIVGEVMGTATVAGIPALATVTGIATEIVSDPDHEAQAERRKKRKKFGSATESGIEIVTEIAIEIGSETVKGGDAMTARKRKMTSLRLTRQTRRLP
mmetsp:Transcript_6692/g.16024  ORF Transcript_6692/g.16024 Transcript_6692/m.16024 type:complete len:108 (+) Transcript_6692:322-645(+)